MRDTAPHDDLLRGGPGFDNCDGESQVYADDVDWEVATGEP